VGQLRDIANALGEAARDVDLSGLTDNSGNPVPAANDLTVFPYMWFNPTPPAIDIWPADPSAEDAAFGPSSTKFWTVRARVAAVDEEGNQDILLALLEDGGPTSLRAALSSDVTLDGLVEGLDVEQNPTGYQVFRTLAGADFSHQGQLLGFELRVRTFVNAEMVS
jgi:hypothetical protein